MTFEIIDGGKSKSPKNKSVTNKTEQLKMFVQHMRSIETSIASVKTMAIKLDWHELNVMLIACHKQIIDTLGYVKKTSTASGIKPTPKKNFLKLIDKD